MNERNLVILDDEVRYASGLEENISMRTELALCVFICTSMESVKRLQQCREIHILVMDEKFACGQRSEIEVQKVYVLTKEQGRSAEGYDNFIYKFQSADHILAEIFETYCEATRDNLLREFRKRKQKLIGVYSPIHRVGKTTFALALGKELARKEKTLYLNMEEYPDVNGRFQIVEGRNLGDLLYFLKQEKKNAALRFSTMAIKQEDLDYIPPIGNVSDLKEVTVEEWKLLIHAVLDESVYENVILDLSESVQGLLSLLKMCDRIYMPILEDAVSVNRMQQFEQNLEELGMEGVIERTVRFLAVDDMEICARKRVKEEW